MHLAREVLDKEILDRDGFKGGKVDDLLLELREGEPPVVRSILTQHGALTCDMGRLLPRINAWVRRRLLALEPDTAPVTLGWERVTRIDVTVHIDQSRWDANLMRSEQAVWERWISRLPLARR